jgi:twinkle protein
LWKNTPTARIGMLFLEESAEQTATHLVGLHAGQAAHLPDEEVHWDHEKRLEWFDKVAEGDRFLFWDNRMENLTTQTVMRQMKYMVKVLKVDYIFFDHVSMVMGGSVEGDERRNIDNFMTELRQFIEATGVTVFAINHLAKSGSQGKSAEEGGRVRLSDARGSGAIYQLADVVIGCERDQQNEDTEAANEVQYRVLKNRPTSNVGVATKAKYDRLKDRLMEQFIQPLKPL